MPRQAWFTPADSSRAARGPPAENYNLSAELYCSWDMCGHTSLVPMWSASPIQLIHNYTIADIMTMQVLSNSVAKALQLEGRSDTVETARFCEIFNEFFDCLNVRCQEECVRRRKPDMRPFREETDPRLHICMAYSYLIFTILIIV